MATPNVAALPISIPIKNNSLTLGKAVSKAATITMIVLAALMMSEHLSISQASVGMLICGGIKSIRLMYKYSEKQETSKSVTMKLVFLISPALLMGLLGLTYTGLSVKTLGWIYFGPLLTKVTCQFIRLAGMKYQASDAKHRFDSSIDAIFWRELDGWKNKYPLEGNSLIQAIYSEVLEKLTSNLQKDALGDKEYNLLFDFFRRYILEVQGLEAVLDYRDFIEVLQKNPVAQANLNAFFGAHQQLTILPEMIHCWKQMVAWEKAKADLCPIGSSQQGEKS